MRSEFRRIVIWFKERNMKNGVKTGEVRGKFEEVSRGRDSAYDWIGSKPAVIKLFGRSGSFNVTT